MPYFTIYERPRLKLLMNYLGDTMGICAQPEPVPVTVPQQSLVQAQAYFNGTCSMCHGLNGDGRSNYARGLEPAPPDFRRYSISPQRAFEVIRDGYPGTAMPSFRQLPQELRWGLVQHELSLRQPQPTGRAQIMATASK